MHIIKRITPFVYFLAVGATFEDIFCHRQIVLRTVRLTSFFCFSTTAPMLKDDLKSESPIYKRYFDFSLSCF